MSVRLEPAPLATRPTVTVVIPHYNYGQYLPVAVRSVLEQPGVELEVIIVDDASTDGSVHVARELAASDSRIKLIEHAVNKRHIATYNDGLTVASGKYVVLLSADDALAPGSLARATALLEARPDVGLVYGFAQEFVTDLPEANEAARVSWTVWDGGEWIARMCRRGRNIIMNPEAIMRTDLLDDIGYYDARFPHSADMYLWMRAAARAKVGRVNGPVQAFYRQHAANMHATEFGGQLDDLRAVRATFAQFFQEDGHLVSGAGRLQQVADRAVARDALRRALLAGGEQAEVAHRAYLDFATETGAGSGTVGLYSLALRPALRPAFAWEESMRWRVRYRRHRRWGT